MARRGDVIERPRAFVFPTPHPSRIYIGGGGWSGKVMQLYGRMLRALFAFPFMLIGRLFTGVGGSIKGGSGKKKRKP